MPDSSTAVMQTSMQNSSPPPYTWNKNIYVCICIHIYTLHTYTHTFAKCIHMYAVYTCACKRTHTTSIHSSLDKRLWVWTKRFYLSKLHLLNKTHSSHRNKLPYVIPPCSPQNKWTLHYSSTEFPYLTELNLNWFLHTIPKQNLFI